MLKNNTAAIKSAHGKVMLTARCFRVMDGFVAFRYYPQDRMCWRDGRLLIPCKVSLKRRNHGFLHIVSAIARFPFPEMISFSTVSLLVLDSFDI